MEPNESKSTVSTGFSFTNMSMMNMTDFEHPFNQPALKITFILLYSVVFAMCFLGNIIVLIVFAYSKRMRTRTNLFLANLAVADFSVGVFCVLPSLFVHMSTVWFFGQVMCKLYFFVHYMAYTASILLLVVIAVERYIAIMHPLRSRRFLTASRLIVAQVVVWVVAAVYNIPSLIVFDLVKSMGDDYCFFANNIIDMKAYYTAHFVLWYMLPLVVIVFMYGHISYTLWATSSLTAAAAGSGHRHNGSINTTLTTAVDTPHHHPHHHLHHHHGSSSRLNPAGRTCLTYCEGMTGENGFGSVVTVGAGRGNGETRREGSMGGSRPSLLRYGEEEDGPNTATRGKVGGVACWNNSDKCCRACFTQGREKNGHIEMVPITACNGCFNCNSNCLANGSPGYGQRGGSPNYRQQRNNVRRGRNSSDEYPYEMSDMGSSDDYDSYRSRLMEDNRVGGDREGKRGSSASATPTGPRRLRCHYRVSSQRGLQSRRRVIRLLIAVVTTFAVCVLPYHVRNLLHYWQVQTPAGGILDILSPLSSVMMYLNSGLNPFIYWMFSDHFRRSLKESLCFWKRSRHYPSSAFALQAPRR